MQAEVSTTPLWLSDTKVLSPTLVSIAPTDTFELADPMSNQGAMAYRGEAKSLRFHGRRTDPSPSFLFFCILFLPTVIKLDFVSKPPHSHPI